MNLEELILKEVAEIHLPGFFVTVDFSATGCDPPAAYRGFFERKARIHSSRIERA